jgi:AraC family transcriptional regulator
MKHSTENEYNKKVNEIIDYISSHLHEPLNLDFLATKACISTYHFHRIMKAYLQEPLASYISRQRLERAAQYLQTRKIKLADLALSVGYETPQSFSKAFKKYFKITPSVFAKTAHSDFVLTHKTNIIDNRELKYEICTLSVDIYLVYIRIIGKYGDPEPYAKAWNKLGRFLKKNNLLNKNTKWIGLSFDNPNITKYKDCRFYACATVSNEFQANGEFGKIKIKKGKFAVYENIGNYNNLQNVYNNIYFNCAHILRDALSFEEYVTHSDIDENNITKIYIPIE